MQANELLLVGLLAGVAGLFFPVFRLLVVYIPVFDRDLVRAVAINVDLALWHPLLAGGDVRLGLLDELPVRALHLIQLQAT